MPQPLIEIHAEFAFYVNRNGERTRPHFMVHWEGFPTAFGKLFLLCICINLTRDSKPFIIPMSSRSSLHLSRSDMLKLGC